MKIVHLSILGQDSSCTVAMMAVSQPRKRLAIHVLQRRYRLGEGAISIFLPPALALSLCGDAITFPHSYGSTPLAIVFCRFRPRLFLTTAAMVLPPQGRWNGLPCMHFSLISKLVPCSSPSSFKHHEPFSILLHHLQHRKHVFAIQP